MRIEYKAVTGKDLKPPAAKKGRAQRGGC
jgi:hypothetical protein